MRQKQKESEEGKTKAKKDMRNYEKNDDDCGNDLSSIFLTAPVDWLDDYTYDVYECGETEDSKHDITVVEHDECDLLHLQPDGLFLLGAGAEQQPWRFIGREKQVYYYYDDFKALLLD